MGYSRSRRVPEKEMLIPGSPEWRRAITASKVPTILGLNRWQTVGELWSQMRGESIEKERSPEEVERMALGHDAEFLIQSAWLRRNPGWRLGQVKKGSREVAMWDRTLSFPNQVTIDTLVWRGKRAKILECKSSGDQYKWDPDGDLPDDVMAQVQFQMGVSGIHEATVGALLWWTKGVHFWEVEFNQAVFNGIVKNCEEFIESLEGDEPPGINPFLLDALRPVPAEAEGEVAGDDDKDLIALMDIREEIKELQGREKWLKETLSQRYTGSQKVTVAGKSVMSWQKGRFSSARVPQEYRHLLSDRSYQKMSFDPAVLAEKNPDIYEIAVGAGSFRFT